MSTQKESESSAINFDFGKKDPQVGEKRQRTEISSDAPQSFGFSFSSAPISPEPRMYSKEEYSRLYNQLVKKIEALQRLEDAYVKLRSEKKRLDMENATLSRDLSLIIKITQAYDENGKKRV